VNSRKHVDFVSALVFMALSIYVIVSAFGYHDQIQSRGNIVWNQSPGFFPIIVGVALLICSIILFLRSIKGSGIWAHIQTVGAGAKEFFTSKMTLRAVIGLIWMGLFVFVFLEMLGFVVSSLLYSITLMVYLQAGDIFRKPAGKAILHILILAVIATAVVFATYFLFQEIFRAPLP